MPAPVPTARRRHSAGERWVRRTARTLSVLALVSGTLAYLGIGVLTKFDLVERYQSLFAVCLTVFVIAAGARVVWALVVLVRKAVLRRPRRRALATLAARLGWQWRPKRRAIPTETRVALLQIDPEEWITEHDPKPRFTELLYGTFAGRAALSVHIERGSRLMPRVDQIVALQLPGALPKLRVTDRADDPYGVDPAQQFESARFNDAWGVHADDVRYASAFTHPRMMRLLTGLDPSIAGLYVRGSWLVSRAPVAFSPRLLQLHLDALERVSEAVPDWVWDEFGHRAPSASFLAQARSRR